MLLGHGHGLGFIKKEPSVNYAASGEFQTLTTFTVEAYTGSSVDWGIPYSAQYEDFSDASAILNDGVGAYTSYLQAAGLEKNVPDGVTINGIEVKIKKRGLAVPGVQDKSLMLVKGGVISSTDKADTVTDYPVTEGFVIAGGAADLWGLALTAADVNAGNFGAALSSKTTEAVSIPYIDVIQIAVHYT